MSKTPKVTLIDGEKVKLEIDSVGNRNQKFIRISEGFIAGIVNQEGWNGIYIWHEVEGIYKYLGDMVFQKNADGSVIWKIIPAVPEEMKEKAGNFLMDQFKSFDPKADSTNLELLTLAE